jgi:hypothetical protein
MHFLIPIDFQEVEFDIQFSMRVFVLQIFSKNLKDPKFLLNNCRTGEIFVNNSTLQHSYYFHNSGLNTGKHHETIV